jgi:hypothetical protein
MADLSKPPKLVDWKLMKLETQITNDCVCYKYDEFGEPVLDETGEPVPSDFCYGDCYTEQVADFTDNILPEWLKRHDLDTDSPVFISGSGMTWLGKSGHTERKASEIISTLEIDGQFILRIVCDTETGLLKIVRSSHDELGASFVVVPID